MAVLKPLVSQGRGSASGDFEVCGGAGIIGAADRREVDGWGAGNVLHKPTRAVPAAARDKTASPKGSVGGRRRYVHSPTARHSDCISQGNPVRSVGGDIEGRAADFRDRAAPLPKEHGAVIGKLIHGRAGRGQPANVRPQLRTDAAENAADKRGAVGLYGQTIHVGFQIKKAVRREKEQLRIEATIQGSIVEDASKPIARLARQLTKATADENGSVSLDRQAGGRHIRGGTEVRLETAVGVEAPEIGARNAVKHGKLAADQDVIVASTARQSIAKLDPVDTTAEKLVSRLPFGLRRNRLVPVEIACRVVVPPTRIFPSG